MVVHRPAASATKDSRQPLNDLHFSQSTINPMSIAAVDSTILILTLFPHSPIMTTAAPSNIAGPSKQVQTTTGVDAQPPCVLFALEQFECSASDTIRCWPLERIFRQ